MQHVQLSVNAFVEETGMKRISFQQTVSEWLKQFGTTSGNEVAFLGYSFMIIDEVHVKDNILIYKDDVVTCAVITYGIIARHSQAEAFVGYPCMLEWAWK